MRLITRHLSPLVRSRRRFPFILIIGILLCTAFILFNINRNHETNNSYQQLILKSTDGLLNIITEKTTAIAQK
jgi:hypothetical protein